MKALGLTQEVHLKLFSLSKGEESGIPGVEVKFVDIRRKYTQLINENMAKYKSSISDDKEAEIYKKFEVAYANYNERGKALFGIIERKERVGG